MNGFNSLLMSNPIAVLEKLMVDNATTAKNPGRPDMVRQLNRDGHGIFDLTVIATDPYKLYFDYFIDSPANDDPIKAYWCPFLPGIDDVGFVDVPRSNPTHHLVLTGAMQGCAFVLTDSPVSSNFFRVYHNQHPTGTKTWASMKTANPSMKIISIFSEDPTKLPSDYQKYAVNYGYGNAAAFNKGTPTNAFNLLWYAQDGTWAYISQSNLFNPQPKGYTIERDNDMPLWTGPTGVVKS